MLQITLNNITVNPQRPDAPKASFGSQDVPHGTHSVIYKAAKHLITEHQAAIALPVFTKEQIAERVALQASKLSFIDLEHEHIDQSIPSHLQVKLTPPDAKQIKAKLDELNGYTDEQVASYIMQHSKPETTKDGVVTPAVTVTEADAIKALGKPSFAMMPGMPAPAANTLASAEAALKEEIVQTTAKYQVAYIIDQCLEVPELSDEFIALFTKTETPAL
jgi:hypothetical protein